MDGTAAGIPSASDRRGGGSARGRLGPLLEAFQAVRAETERRAAFLAPEDQVVQSMPDASPTKWHRAHTAWFFEEFLLRPHLPGYRTFDASFAFLFNSYYVAAGPRHARPQRGLVTRPGAAEVGAYRAHVDAAVVRLLSGQVDAGVLDTLETGLQHEQQHQELLLTDILHAFAQNPLEPAYDPAWRAPAASAAQGGFALPPGLHRIGHCGEGYGFDNEGPAHDVWVRPASLARGLVSNREWLAFMADGGYRTPALWLSDGWGAVQAEAWAAPGYWRQEADGGWSAMTLGGRRRVDEAEPVRHVSYYEADAFARWAGQELPDEAEWEVAAAAGGLADAFGHAWQWTRSAYLPYPGFRSAAGALGEYNGKFMVNQMVLRGSSVATPAGHSRPSYRNFFPPGARWQFTGVRLAEAAQ